MAMPSKAKKPEQTYTSKEIQLVIKTSQQRKYPEPDCFTREFYQTAKEKLILTILKLAQKLQ